MNSGVAPGNQGRNHTFALYMGVGCVIAQAFFSRGASQISLKSRVFQWNLAEFSGIYQKGRKGAGVKGAGGRKLSHFSFCCAFRCCVVYSRCFPV